MGDIKRIINKPCNHQIYAHCECTLLAHMHANRDQNFLPHIGVSKLSCRGCFFTIQAANTVCHTNFHTKGCHNKWYYLWAVPSSFAADKAVTSEIYSNLGDRFGTVHSGFRPNTQKLDSDSDAGKISSADDTGDEDGVERKKLKQVAGRWRQRFKESYYCHHNSQEKSKRWLINHTRKLRLRLWRLIILSTTTCFACDLLTRA